MIDAFGGEHLLNTASVPGTPAPRAGALSRVVAAGQSPTTVSNIARLASRGVSAFHPTASLLPSSHSATPDPSTCVYVPYRHVRTGTGERAMVPLRLNPATGIRTPVVPPPVGFHPTVADGAEESSNLLQWLADLLCRHPAEHAVDPYAYQADVPIPPTRQRLSPIDVRQLDFDDDQAADNPHASQSCILSAKTLASLKTKPELAVSSAELCQVVEDDDEDEEIEHVMGLCNPGN